MGVRDDRRRRSAFPVTPSGILKTHTRSGFPKTAGIFGHPVTGNRNSDAVTGSLEGVPFPASERTEYENGRTFTTVFGRMPKTACCSLDVFYFIFLIFFL